MPDRAARVASVRSLPLLRVLVDTISVHVPLESVAGAPTTEHRRVDGSGLGFNGSLIHLGTSCVTGPSQDGPTRVLTRQHRTLSTSRRAKSRNASPSGTLGGR